MCGINGLIKKNSNTTRALSVLEKMNNQIIHRGPDDDGFYIDDLSGSVIGMAMRRLSIIDLSTGKQPIFSNDRNKVIVFNGEIYNYLSLRQELEKKGYLFSTSSDTEVIINLYDCYGTECFRMLDGMFALSIFDRVKNSLYIARDFFGEKPLYYCNNETGFYWASELKSIVKINAFPLTINKVALNLYFQLTYIPAPLTIYNEVRKLEANNYLQVNIDTMLIRQFEIHKNYKSHAILNKGQATKDIHDLVFQSVESRSVSDVALGTFLSGGVDSSIVSLCLAQQSRKKIDTFSIGFENQQFDETDKSRLVSKLIQSNHHEFIFRGKDLGENVSEVILNFDEPFADYSALATYIVAKNTKEYVKVALTGDGGDELFGGYNKYYIGNLNHKYTQIVPRLIHKNLIFLGNQFLKTSNESRGKLYKINRLLNSIDYNGDFYYSIISLGFHSKEIETLLLSHNLSPNSFEFFKKLIGDKCKKLTDFREIDRIISLEGDLLVKVDRSSMLTSLECRAPFLNKTLWDYTSGLPENYLINGWDKKHILKEAFKQYFPKGFLDKSKKGFEVPVGELLRSNLKEELLYYSDRKRLDDQQIFNSDYIIKLVNNHINYIVDNTFRVWTFYCFQKWYFNSYIS